MPGGYAHVDEKGTEKMINNVKVALRDEPWVFWGSGDLFVFGWTHEGGKEIYVCRIEKELECVEAR